MHDSNRMRAHRQLNSTENPHKKRDRIESCLWSHLHVGRHSRIWPGGKLKIIHPQISRELRCEVDHTGNPRPSPAPRLSLSGPLEQALQVLQEKMVPDHVHRPLQVRGNSWTSFRQRQHTTQECILPTISTPPQCGAQCPSEKLLLLPDAHQFHQKHYLRLHVAPVRLDCLSCQRSCDRAVYKHVHLPKREAGEWDRVIGDTPIEVSSKRCWLERLI